MGPIDRNLRHACMHPSSHGKLRVAGSCQETLHARHVGPVDGRLLLLVHHAQYALPEVALLQPKMPLAGSVPDQRASVAPTQCLTDAGHRSRWSWTSTAPGSESLVWREAEQKPKEGEDIHHPSRSALGFSLHSPAGVPPRAPSLCSSRRDSSCTWPPAWRCAPSCKHRSTLLPPLGSAHDSQHVRSE